MFAVPNPKVLLLATLGLALAGCANETDPNSPEGKRQAAFQAFLSHSEPMGGMLGDRLPFDGEAFAVHAQGLAATVDAPWGHFPDVGESEQEHAALPEVWTDAEGFAQAIDRYRNAVAELVAVTEQGVEAPEQVAEPFRAVQQSCKGCHQTYRR